MGKSWNKWRKVGISGEKRGKAGKSGENRGKAAKSREKRRKAGKKFEKVRKSSKKFEKVRKRSKKVEKVRKNWEIFSPNLDDRKSLSITFLAISDQYATLFLFFFSKWPPAPILDPDFAKIDRELPL